MSHFDKPPSGYMRQNGTGKGWLRAAPNPHSRAIKKLAEKNASLEEQIAELRALIEDTPAKKKKGKKDG